MPVKGHKSGNCAGLRPLRDAFGRWLTLGSRCGPPLVFSSLLRSCDVTAAQRQTGSQTVTPNAPPNNKKTQLLCKNQHFHNFSASVPETFLPSTFEFSSRLIPPTLNSSVCDCGTSKLGFWRPVFLYFTTDPCTTRSTDEGFHVPSQPGVRAERATTSPCSCSFQNRTLHSVGAAQLLSLCLNGRLMTTTFCSTRWGHAGEGGGDGRGGGGGSGGWLREGDGGHPTHKA